MRSIAILLGASALIAFGATTNASAQLFDFNNNQVPEGWVRLPTKPGNSPAFIRNGRMEAVATNTRISIRYALASSYESVTVRFQGKINRSVNGSVNQISLIGGDAGGLSLRHNNKATLFGSENSLLFISGPVRKEDEVRYPQTFPVFDYEITITGSNTTGTITNTDTGEQFEVGFDDLTLAAEDIEGVQIDVWHTTGAGATWVDDVEIELGPEVGANEPPTAIAGDDRSFQTFGETITLDGSASDDDNTPSSELVYDWTLIAPPGSAATLSGANSAMPSFVADARGDYEAQLIVTDAEGLSSTPDVVLISSNNLAPTAEAGMNQVILVGTTVLLDGVGSTDPENDPLSYAWGFRVTPEDSFSVLSGANSRTPFFAPDVPGDYTIDLVASDAFGAGAADSVSITALSPDGFANFKIAEVAELIAELPASEVTSEGNREKLLGFLSKAAIRSEQDDYIRAIAELENALRRTDGCILRGSPDGKGVSRDWITNCNAQLEIYDCLLQAVNALKDVGGLVGDPPNDVTLQVIAALQAIVDANPGSPTDDKLTDVIEKLEVVLVELGKRRPDVEAAAGALEGAIGDLEAALSDKLIEAQQGVGLLTQLAAVARQLASDAIAEAIDNKGDKGKIKDADKALAAGDRELSRENFKDAAAAYKDATSQANGA